MYSSLFSFLFFSFPTAYVGQAFLKGGNDFAILSRSFSDYTWNTCFQAGRPFIDPGASATDNIDASAILNEMVISDGPTCCPLQTDIIGVFSVRINHTCSRKNSGYTQIASVTDLLGLEIV